VYKTEVFLYFYMGVVADGMTTLLCWSLKVPLKTRQPMVWQVPVHSADKKWFNFEKVTGKPAEVMNMLEICGYRWASHTDENELN